ncbi:beta-ketoacyl-ACP synthase 3 [Limisalsivibrio acetivorans]|uniref:beta-ketoacyl-ACP synthase 3 n=1 Tax=Limisalsivibrio acetivorans TaxID=1304888 RepID=UPI00047DECDA
MFSRISGTGSFFPPDVMTNHDFEKFLETSDEWIITRTGIRERRIAKNHSCSDMGYEAGLKALEMAEMKPEDLDGIIFATFTPDTTMPSCACRVQSLLGIPGTFAFDIAAACTGFLYACNVADSMIKSGSAKNILVIGAEKITATVDWSDRSTCILFGDGAGAAVLSASDKPGIRSVSVHADGDHADLLALPCLGTEYLAKRNELDIEAGMIKMSGNEVFKIAVRAMAEVASRAVEMSGLSYDDIDFLIPHQANLRIIDATAKRLNLAQERVIINLDRYGNTSAATIPTALDGAVREGRIKRGMNIASAAFGGGLTWGGMVFTF